MFVRIGTFTIDPAKLDALSEHFRVNAVQAFSSHNGFLGYQAYTDKAQGKFVGISRWASRETLETSSASAQEVLDYAKALGATIIGEPQILEEVFDAKPVQ